MVAVNFMGFIVLGLMLGPASGALPTDLASLLNADAYFQNNNIPAEADKLGELISKTPADNKGRLTQLLAIRWLGENAAKLGDQKKPAQIALAKLAQGPQGFARDYAVRALARIDGKPVPALNPMPKDSLRAEAFAWFPADVTLVGALDLRPAAGQTDLPDDSSVVKETKALLGKLQEFMGAQARAEIERFAEAVGNVRVDRIAFAFDADQPDRKKRRIIIRGTGAGDGRALLTFIQQTTGGGEIKEEKGPKGESILLFLPPQRRPPAVAVIDNTDLIMTGYEANDGDHEALLREVLDVRAGKKGNALTGPLAKDLQAARAEARGLLAGAPPEDLRRELANSRVGAIPRRVTIDLTREQTGGGFVLSLKLRAVMENEADAKALVDGFNTLKLMAVKELDGLGKPKDTITLKKTIQAVALKAEGASVTGEAGISSEVMQATLKLVLETIPKEIRP